MADLSNYTPVYVRTTGNDTTGDSSSGSPYLTAQKAFDSIPKTSLLLHFDGANNSTNFVDSGDYGLSVTVNGNAKISTSQSKFGGSSLSLDGDGDFLTLSQLQNLGTLNFTIECWIFINIGATGYRRIVSQQSNNLQPDIIFRIEETGELAFYGPSTIVTGTTVLSDGQWYHVAAVRIGDTLTLYLDGVQDVSASFTDNLGSTGYHNIGAFFNGSESWDGYIDDLRITQGQALYTSNFTPPSAPLTTITDNIVIDCGVGNFGGINLSNNWPARISVRGVNSNDSNLGNINGDGNDEVWDAEYTILYAPSTPGYNINLTSNKTINLGNVTSNGGNGTLYVNAIDRNGGNIILTDCVTNNIESNGAGYTEGNGSNAGSITINNSISNNITCDGGNDYNGGTAGTITINNSICGNLQANGGDAESDGGNAGSIIVNSSTCGTISVVGGDGGNFGGAGGSAVITDSVCGNMTAQNSVGGTDPYTNNNTGTVTLAGSTIVPNIVIARSSITATNLKKGRGVKGSNILGLI